MTVPELDDEYWLMVEEHIALLELYLNANMLFIVEDRHTLAPTLVAKIMCGVLSRMQHCATESLRGAVRKSRRQHQSAHELASAMLFMSS